jgi:hypothetical protein
MKALKTQKKNALKKSALKTTKLDLFKNLIIKFAKKINYATTMKKLLKLDW